MPGSTIAEITSAPAANAYSAVPMLKPRPLTSADRRSNERPVARTMPARNGSQFCRNVPSTVRCSRMTNGMETSAPITVASSWAAIRTANV